MAETNSDEAISETAGNGGWTKAEDVAQETALASSRVEAAKQKGLEAAGARSETEPDEEPLSNDLEPPAIESELSGRKSAAQKNGAAEQALEAGKDLVKKNIKKRFWLWALSVIGGFLASTAVFWIPLLLILFIAVMTYSYWTNHKWDLTLYWKAATEDYAGLINNAINDTSAYDSTAAPKTAETQTIPAANEVPAEPAE